MIADEVREHLRDYLELKRISVKGRSFKCFNHDDANASAGLTGDGKGFRCFACNVKGDIFTAYSILEGKDIKGENFFYVLKELADLFHISYEIETQQKLIKENEYIYTDADSIKIYKIARYHKEDENGNIIMKYNGKMEKIFGAFTKIEDKWVKGMISGKRYLYK